MRIRINILPAIVTLGNLICGFAAIGVAAGAQLAWKGAEPDPAKGLGAFALAGSLILLAMLFDALDGQIARITNVATGFGAQLDSLCDMVSFGIAPACIILLEASSRSSLFEHPKYAWVCAALFAVCAALRLARFNVETSPGETAHVCFNGLPTPAAAAVIASLAIFDRTVQDKALSPVRIMPVAAVILGGLMISHLRYAHLLNLLFRERRPFTYLVLLIFAVSTLLALPEHYELILLCGSVAYVISGPFTHAWLFLRHKRSPEPPGPAGPNTPESGALL